MEKKNIGSNAGIIWNYLYQRGKSSIRELGEHTNLSSLNLGLAIGWLARENKIQFTTEDELMLIELVAEPTDIYY